MCLSLQAMNTIIYKGLKFLTDRSSAILFMNWINYIFVKKKSLFVLLFYLMPYKRT